MQAPQHLSDRGDPRLIQATEELGHILTQYVGAPITEGIIAQAQALVNDFRASKLLEGVIMPKMTVVAFEHAGYMQVWPKDLDENDLQVRLMMVLKELQKRGRNVDPYNIMKAIKRAYPDYNPSTSRLKLAPKPLHLN